MGKVCQGGVHDGTRSRWACSHAVAPSRDPLQLVSKAKYLSHKHAPPVEGARAFGSRRVMRASRVKHGSSTKEKAHGDKSEAVPVSPVKEARSSVTAGPNINDQSTSVARRVSRDNADQRRCWSIPQRLHRARAREAGVLI